MKVESRGKYPGVKLHLEPEEVEAFFLIKDSLEDPSNYMKDELVECSVDLLRKMDKKLRKLKEETPGLLEKRTPEQIEAILIKETAKSALQLKMIQAGQDHSKINPEVLKEALLGYVKEK